MAIWNSIGSLELVRRMCLSHVVYCSHKALKARTDTDAARYEEEIRLAEEMAAAVEFQLKHIKVTEEG